MMSSPPLRSALRIALFATAATSASLAEPCDSSSCQLVTRGQNGALAKGAFRVDLSYRFTNDDVMLRGSERAPYVLLPKVDFENRRLRPYYHSDVGGREGFIQADVAYGVTSRITVLGSLPVLARRSYRIAHPPQLEENYLTEGNGDALVGMRYAIRQGHWGQAVAGLSVKIPTGRYRLVSASPFDPGILDPELQPGSGSFDFAGSIQYNRHLDGLGFDLTAAASYQANLSSRLDYRFGNDAIGSVTVGRRLFEPLRASVQIKAFHKGRSVFESAPVPATGATIVYAIPGMSLGVTGRISVYAFGQLPVYRYVNEAQLAPRWGLVAGVSRSF